MKFTKKLIKEIEKAINNDEVCIDEIDSISIVTDATIGIIDDVTGVQYVVVDASKIKMFNNGKTALVEIGYTPS